MVTYQFDRRSKFQFNLFSPLLPLHRNQNQHVFGQLELANLTKKNTLT